MQVRVRLFARFRESAGKGELALEIPPKTTVGELWDCVAAQYQGLLPAKRYVLFAIGNEYVRPEHPVEEGQEVCCFPPVSGGRDV